MPRPLPFALAALLLAPLARAETPLRFDFGTDQAAPGFTAVQPETNFTRARGYGFEPGAAVRAVDRGGDQALAKLRGDFVTGE